MSVEAVIATQVIDTTTVGRSVMTAVDAAAARTALGLGTLATQSGTFSGTHSGTSSGTNTGDQTTISGNAGSATVLQTARTINGVSFDGSANITVTAAGSTLSDTVTVAKGGTGLTALGTALQVLRVNAGATALEYATASGGTPGGSSGQVQYNNAGAFGGMTAVVYAGSGTLVTVTSQAASDVPLLVKGAASQSGNLIETRNSSNTVLTAITSAGDILCGMLRSSTGATTSAIYVAEGLRKRWELSGAEQNQYMTTGCAFDGGSNWILIGGGGAPSYAPGSSTHRVSLDISNRILYLGTNVLTSPLGYTLAGTGGSGTNIAGGKITVAAGRSTGNATPAVVALASTSAGSSGTTLQTLRDCLQVDGNTTAAETPLLLLDIDKGTLQRVSIGAADSGGTGFKVLRVPN
jgi:hypothetical protein